MRVACLGGEWRRLGPVRGTNGEQTFRRAFLQVSPCVVQQARLPSRDSRETPGDCPLGLTISRHAQCQALLQTAVLAAVSASAIDGAVLLAGAGVGRVTLLAPAEEALGEA